MRVPSHVPDPELESRLLVIADRIRQCRKSLRVSVSTAAEAAVMSRSTYVRIERGEPSVALKSYRDAAKVLGLEIDLGTETAQPVAAVADGSMPVLDRPAPLPETIRLADHPQLRRIAGNSRDASAITPAQAFGLYERYWRYVDYEAMDLAERQFLTQLIYHIGNGAFWGRGPRFLLTP
jgi:transcriptional regulator with XRE-family HTH domain